MWSVAFPRAAAGGLDPALVNFRRHRLRIGVEHGGPDTKASWVSNS
jgi:hypothetical protein